MLHDGPRELSKEEMIKRLAKLDTETPKGKALFAKHRAPKRRK